MKTGYHAPRITVTCHGYEGHTCYNEVDTTPQHEHDAKCKECKKRIHIMSSQKYQKRIADGRTATKGQPGRKPTFGGDFIKPVFCKACGSRLLDCRCMDRLDGEQRLKAWRW